MDNLLKLYRINKRAGLSYNAPQFEEILISSANGIQKQPYEGMVCLNENGGLGNTEDLYGAKVVPLHVKGVEVGMIVRLTKHTPACAAIVLTWTAASGEEGDAHVHYLLSSGACVSSSNMLSADTVASLTVCNVKRILTLGIKFASLKDFIEQRAATPIAAKLVGDDYIRLDAFVAASRRMETCSMWTYVATVVTPFDVAVPNAKRDRNINRVLERLEFLSKRLASVS